MKCIYCLTNEAEGQIICGFADWNRKLKFGFEAVICNECFEEVKEDTLALMDKLEAKRKKKQQELSKLEKSLKMEDGKTS